MLLCPRCLTENSDSAEACSSCRNTLGPQNWVVDRPRTQETPETFERRLAERRQFEQARDAEARGSDSPPKLLAAAASIALFMVSAAYIYFAWVLLQEIELVRDFDPGGTESLTERVVELRRWNDRLDAALLAALGTTLLAAIGFLAWEYRAFRNLSVSNSAIRRYSPRSTLIWWFVPIANLFRPYQVMRELSDDRAPTDDGTPTENRDPPFRWWWGLWTAGWIGLWVGRPILVRSDALGSLWEGLIMSALALMQGAAALLAIALIWQVVARQGARRSAAAPSAVAEFGAEGARAPNRRWPVGTLLLGVPASAALLAALVLFVANDQEETGFDPPVGSPGQEAFHPADWTKFEAGGAEIWLPPSFQGGSPTEGDLEIVRESLRTLGPEFAGAGETIGEGIVLLALDLESGPAFVTSVQVAREPVISVISANAYSDIVVSGLGALGTRLVQREELAVEGFEAVRAVLETPASGQTIRQLIYFIKTEQNVVWFVVFSSAREEFERRLPTFELSVRMLVVRDVHVGTLIVPAEPAVAASDTTSPGEPATALPTAAAEGFSANEIFERVSPSIVFITTLTSGGSGILIDETHVLTNAHVVWPHQEAEVLVPQGTPLLGRVVGWDLMADIAVLEVPRVSLGMTTPLTIVDGTNLPIGSELFLIGYPAEFERSPSPTISRGVLSRVRSWEPLGISFLQTDAAIASGQSGGALVSASGEVVGLSGRRLGEGNFALATSMPDVMSRVGRLLQGENVDGLGDRRYSMDGAGNEIQFTLPNLFFEQALLLNQPIGTRVMLELEGDHNGYFVAGLAGVPPIFWSIFADDTLTGLEEGELTTEFDAPHLVAAGQSDANSGEFVIRSNVPYPSPSLMIPMTDAKCPWARRSQRISIT